MPTPPVIALLRSITFVAVLIALGLTGAWSARVSGSDRPSAILRVVSGGAARLALTYEWLLQPHWPKAPATGIHPLTTI